MNKKGNISTLFRYVLNSTVIFYTLPYKVLLGVSILIYNSFIFKSKVVDCRAVSFKFDQDLKYFFSYSHIPIMRN